MISVPRNNDSRYNRLGFSSKAYIFQNKKERIHRNNGRTLAPFHRVTLQGHYSYIFCESLTACFSKFR